MPGLPFRLRRERFLPRGGIVADRAGNEPRDRVHDHGCAQFAAAQHIISDGQFTVSKILADTLVDTFITPTDQDNSFQRGKFRRDILIETFTLRRE